MRPAVLSHFRHPICEGEHRAKAFLKGAAICSISLRYRSCWSFKYICTATLLLSYPTALIPLVDADSEGAVEEGVGVVLEGVEEGVVVVLEGVEEGVVVGTLGPPDTECLVCVNKL